MKIPIFLSIVLLSSPLVQSAGLPKTDAFFKTEKLVQSFKVPGGEVRMISTAKDFKTLNAELKKTLGEGWKTEEPKETDQFDEAKRKALGFSKDQFVIYVQPDNPKLKVTFGLTTLKGKEKGELTAILTVIKNLKN